MSHILSVEVHELNGRNQPIEFALQRQVNIFFGLNGSGKTSLLKIIDSAMSNDVQRIASSSFKRASIALYSATYNRNFSLTYTKSEEDFDLEEKAAISGAAGANAEFRSTIARLRLARATPKSEFWKTTPDPNRGRVQHIQRWAHTYLSTSRLYMDGGQLPSELSVVDGRITRLNVGAQEDALDKNFANALQSLWTRKYGVIIGRVRSIQQEALESIFIDVLAPNSGDKSNKRAKITEISALDADRAFHSMSSFLARRSDKRVQQILGSRENFSERYKTEPRLRRIVNQIDSVESRILAEMKPIQQLSEAVKRLFGAGKSLSFDGPKISIKTDGDAQIGLELLSSGEKHLVRILLAALDAGNSTLLIDEPELSLHIDWQRELISIIRSLNPECQIIAATHSPEIMADVPDENIFRV